MKKQDLIVILGPTAVGKTDLSIALAQRLRTEIISGDSMLVYQGMDIGTAKPSPAEQAGVIHHLIDILEPSSPFSVTDFLERAKERIEVLNARGLVPILAGGTGLYVKSLLEGYQFNKTPGDDSYRRCLEALAKDRGKEYVHQMLAEADAEAAARLHVNDFRRVIRALEVRHLGGESISREKLPADGLAYDAEVIGLTMERAALYDRINKRVERMFAQGLVKEVEALRQNGARKDAQAMKGIGYKEVIDYLDGKVSLDETMNEIKKATRHFAKRQLTWFRKMPYIQWYEVDKTDSGLLVEKIYKKLAGKFSFSEN